MIGSHHLFYYSTHLPILLYFTLGIISAIKSHCSAPYVLYISVAVNAKAFALLLIKREPSHSMCDRSCTFTHTHPHTIRTRLDYMASRIYCCQTYVPTKTLTCTYTQLQACKNLFVIMAAYISCSHTWTCTPESITDTGEPLSSSSKDTHTHTHIHTNKHTH